MILFLLVTAGVVILDQITKLIVIKCVAEGTVAFGVNGLFHLVHIKNEGAAFGMLADHPWIFQVLSVLAIIAIGVYVFISTRAKKNSLLKLLSLGFIAGGGIGNMIDRIAFGKVTDFIDLDFLHFSLFGHRFDFAVFNVADSFVTVGCVMLIIYVIIDEIRTTKIEKARKARIADDYSESSDTDDDN